MAIQVIKTAFTNMSYTPDIPSGALAPTEYNDGLNVETDLRGVKKINGDQTILTNIPGSQLFATANFRVGTQYWIIVATTAGKWWGVASSGITDLTPLATTYSGAYSSTTVFTASWNGNVLFIMDGINPPMYLLPTDTEMRLYDYSYSDQTPNTYVWNYYSGSGWSNVSAGFMRLWSAPNVGSVLIAGNITYTKSSIVYNLPNTLRWSQSFGLNSGPTTWAPTITNVANELEIPLRGPIIDGFPLNGNFYIFSYWDTVVLSPIAYTTTAAPVFGVMPLTKGRGMLNENCWAVVDNMSFGIDSRDIWAFNGTTFTSIGNQKIKKWFYGQLNALYTNQVYMINNTAKNQIEIYYPDANSTGYCNKMISYRYDFQTWNAPRTVTNAVSSVESPIWKSNVPNIATRGIVYSRGGTANVQLIQKDIGNCFISNTAINSYLRRDNINFGEAYSNSVQVHRVLPEVYGSGNIVVQVGGADSVGQTPTFKPNANLAINTSNPWLQINQNTQRVTSVIFSSNDAVNTWSLTAANWQITVTEDSR
jgi:hypothetical protein